MTLQEMITEIPRLSTRERLLLLEALSRAIRDELEGSARSESTAREALVDRLFGALRTDAPPPTDAEIRDAYTNYLHEKYA